MNTGKLFRYSVDYLRLNLPKLTAQMDAEGLFEGLSSNSLEKEYRYLGFDTDLLLSGGNAVMFRMDSALGRPVAEMKRKLLPTGELIYQFSFYSTYFQFPELKPFMVAVVARYGGARVSRVDLALDTDMSVQSLWESKKTSFQKRSHYFEAENWMSTFYLGSKSFNKHHFIRVYDKILDTEKKKKQMIFPEIFSVEDRVYTRIEIQCEVETCKRLGVSVEDVVGFERTPKEDVFKTKLWESFKTLAFNPHTTDFGFLHGEVITQLPKAPPKTSMDRMYAVRMLRSCVRCLHALGYPVQTVVWQEITAMSGNGGAASPPAKAPEPAVRSSEPDPTLLKHPYSE